MHEAAREVLSLDRKKSANYHDFEVLLFNKQLEKENILGAESQEGLLFLDRGAIDILAYCLFYLGFVPYEILSQNQGLANRYNMVFVLDKLPFMHDGLRIEKDEAEAEMIQEEIIKLYTKYGYNPIKIPIMPVEKRVDLILNCIKTS